MKTLKSISIFAMLFISISVSAQTLEGKWMGYDSGGNLLRVEFKPDFTCFFSLNSGIVHTIDYEPYYNVTPYQVVINYIPSAAILSGIKEIRSKAGIFEFISGNRMKFQYIESDGTVFPNSFQGCYVLSSVTDFTIHEEISSDDANQ